MHATSTPKTKSLAERLQEAVDLPPELWEQARRLAIQLDGTPVLPLIGAGTSFDCNQELAGAVSEAMFGYYAKKYGPNLPHDLQSSKRDMGLVADALFTVGKQESVIDALGLGDRGRWPDSDQLPEHFCSYRVLARLAREGCFSEAITLNYDCAFERALDDEGFLFAPAGHFHGAWLNQATVVPDGATHVTLERRGEMVVTKAHGCANTYRRDIAEANDAVRKQKILESIIVRRSQLLDWRTDFWVRDLFADRARRHVILMLGISGQDPVIHIALTRVLEEVYRHLGDRKQEPCGEPRVVVIDPCPDTVALQALVHQGCGCVKPDPSVITHLKVPTDSSMTAVTVAFAVEMLAQRLVSETGMTLPADPTARVVSLMVAAPASLRWAFRLERRSRGVELYQRVLLEQVKGKGYVPLAIGSDRAAESLRVRKRLRDWLGLRAESVQEAVDGHGFVVSWQRGRAFLPLGVTAEELRAIPTAELRLPAESYAAPDTIELVLVADDDGKLVGRSVQTGRTRQLR